MNSNIFNNLEDIKVRQPDFVCDEDAVRAETTAGSGIFSNLGIKILSILGGLLGTLCVMIFIGAAVLESPVASIIGGALFILIAVVVGKTYKSVLADTSVLCMCLAGFVIMGVGLDKEVGDNTMWIIVFFVSMLVLWFSEGFMMSFIGVLIANGSLLALLTISRAHYFYHGFYAYLVLSLVLLSHHEAKIISSGEKINRLYAPIRSAYLISSIVVFSLSNDIFAGDKIPHKWISSVVALVAILFIISYILNTLEMSGSRIRIYLYGLAALMFTPVIFAPAILGSLLILLLSYHYGHRTGFWAGLLSLIYSVSQYYYDLGLSLLVKSEIMLLSGLLFLLAFFLLKKHLVSR